MHRDDRPALSALDDDVRATLAENDAVEPAARQQLEYGPACHLPTLLDGSAVDNRPAGVAGTR